MNELNIISTTITKTYFEILVDKYILNDKKFPTENEALNYLKNYSFSFKEKIYIKKTTISTKIREIPKSLLK